MKKIGTIAFLLLGAIFASFLVEYITRADVGLTFKWIIDRPEFFVFSVIFTVFVMTFILVCVNNVYIMGLVTILLYVVIGIVNRYKLDILNEPILPWDIHFINQVFGLAPAFLKTLNLWPIIAIVVVVVVIFVGVIKFTSFNLLNWKLRVLLGCMSLISIVLIFTHENNAIGKVVEKMEPLNTPTDQGLSAMENGLVVNFVAKIPLMQIEKPKNYSKKAIQEAIDKFVPNETSNENSIVKPNVVMIMSESLFEFEKVVGMKENGESYMPNLLEHKVANMMSHKFGGGTSNVEFEAVTGFNNAFLPVGSVPYQQFMNAGFPSIVDQFDAAGYETMSVHPYKRYFWNRPKAYTSFGFDQSYFREDILEAGRLKDYGQYADDQVVSDYILEYLQKDNPQFVLAVTMQNHGPFLSGEKYADEHITVATEFGKKPNLAFNNYASGVIHSDEVFKKLLTDIEQLNEPTLVVLWGDHLPGLRNSFTKSGFIKDLYNPDLDDIMNMYSTPIVAWNNYGQNLEVEEEYLSTYHIPSLVLEWSNMKKPRYFQFLDEVKKVLPAYNAHISIDSEGNRSYTYPEEYEELIKAFELIQYDMIAGERYSLDVLMK